MVVPALNEEAALGRHLPQLVAEADEVIVSDGGSTDRTVEVARAAGARVVEGSAGRGGQLNRGASLAEADILIFVHADTTLPAGALDRVREAVESGAAGGGFLVEWRSDRAILRFGGRMTNYRSRLTRCPLGDQAQFCRADLFRELGGFRDWPILEDLDFARRLKKHGDIVLLEPPVRASVRRYQKGGITRTITINWMIWILYFVGVSPEWLGRLYRNVR